MSSYTIETYTDDNPLSKSIKRNQIRQFRELSFVEGNDSLSYDKYDPDCIDGDVVMQVDGLSVQDLMSDPQKPKTPKPQTCEKIVGK